MDQKMSEALDEIRSLLDSQTVAVLATEKNHHPYVSLMAFAAAPDLKTIVFLTPENTRKYEYLTHNSRVALLIHNGRNRPEDIDEAAAVSIEGIASVIKDKHTWRNCFLSKQPHMEAFLGHRSTVMISVEVERYILVTRFQNVIEVPILQNPVKE